MIYLFDDDQFNLIETTYQCAFIFSKDFNEVVSYFKDESNIMIDFEKLRPNDFICYHNSFPNRKTNILDKLIHRHELNPKLKLICFSNDSVFNNPEIGESKIKLNKDLFYSNFKIFLDSNYNIRKLIYGEMDLKNELISIILDIKNTMFKMSENDMLDLTYLRPRDLKRICEITEIDYPNFLKSIQEKTVGQFKYFLSTLIQNI